MSWLDEGREKHLWAYKTYKQYVDLYHCYIHPCIEKRVKVLDVRPCHIRRILISTAHQGVNRRTLQLVRMLLQSFFDMVEEDGLRHNPVKPVKVPYEPSRKVVLLTDDEIERFLCSAEKSRLSILYRIVLATEMRTGELLALKWRDVDLQSKSIHVKRQINPGEVGGRLERVKISRCISFGESTCQALQEQQRRLAREVSKAKRWKENDLVFPSTVGTPIYPSNLHRNLERVLEGANLPPLRLHDLRLLAAWRRREQVV